MHFVEEGHSWGSDCTISKWSFRYQEYVDSKYGKTLMVEVLNLSALR